MHRLALIDVGWVRFGSVRAGRVDGMLVAPSAASVSAVAQVAFRRSLRLRGTGFRLGIDSTRRSVVAENRSSGIPAMLAVARRRGLPRPNFRSSLSSFVVTMARSELLNPEVRRWITGLHAQLPTAAHEIALAMPRENYLTNEMLRQWGVDRIAAGQVLRDLVDQGLAVREGARRYARYVLDPRPPPRKGARPPFRIAPRFGARCRRSTPKEGRGDCQRARRTHRTVTLRCPQPSAHPDRGGHRCRRWRGTKPQAALPMGRRLQPLTGRPHWTRGPAFPQHVRSRCLPRAACTDRAAARLPAKTLRPRSNRSVPRKSATSQRARRHPVSQRPLAEIL